MQIGWGLNLALAASVSLAVASLRLFDQSGKAKSRSSAPPNSDPTPVSDKAYRECPHCREPMRRDASVCPHCQRDSEPWIKDGDRWWQSQDGTWRYWDEGAHTWREQAVPVAVDLRDLTTDEAATFAIYANEAEKASNEELAASLLRLPDHASIKRGAVVAEQARRRESLSSQVDTAEPNDAHRD